MLNEKKAKGAPWERVKATVIDSGDLEIFQDGMFTHIYMKFSLFFISHARKAVAEIHRTLMSNGVAFITTSAAVRLCATFTARTASRTARSALLLGPVPQPRMLSEKLVESLIAGGFEAKKTDICNHSVSKKFAEWTMEALMYFTASLVLMITKGWSGKRNRSLIRSFGRTL